MRAMKRAVSIVALPLAVVLAITGCGGGTSKSSSTAGSTSTARTGPPAGAPPGATRFGPGGPPGTASARSQPTQGIGALVLRRGELPGFTGQGGAITATTGSAFAANEGIPRDQIEKEAARLARARFVAGAIEHLVSPSGAEGLSVVDRFRSSKSARAEIAFAATPQPGSKQTDFTVPGIPGARGFDASSAQSSGHNIAFAVGSYYYLVGVGWPTGLSHPPSRARLATAAQRLYKRVQR
jgi:hypothetical protein